MPVMRQGVSSRVLSRNLPLFATFSSLIYALLQRLEVRDDRADKVTVTLIGRFSGEMLSVSVQVVVDAPGCCLGRGALLLF